MPKTVGRSTKLMLFEATTSIVHKVAD